MKKLLSLPSKVHRWEIGVFLLLIAALPFFRSHAIQIAVLTHYAKAKAEVIYQYETWQYNRQVKKAHSQQAASD